MYYLFWTEKFLIIRSVAAQDLCFYSDECLSLLFAAFLFFLLLDLPFQGGRLLGGWALHGHIGWDGHVRVQHWCLTRRHLSAKILMDVTSVKTIKRSHLPVDLLAGRKMQYWFLSHRLTIPPNVRIPLHKRWFEDEQLVEHTSAPHPNAPVWFGECSRCRLYGCRLLPPSCVASDSVA